MRAYRAVIERFIQEFGDGPVEQVTPEQVLTFLNRFTEGNKPYTKRIRYSQLSSFFNFVRNNIDPELRNPCDRPMIRKLYRERVPLTDHAFEAFDSLNSSWALTLTWSLLLAISLLLWLTPAMSPVISAAAVELWLSSR